VKSCLRVVCYEGLLEKHVPYCLTLRVVLYEELCVMKCCLRVVRYEGLSVMKCCLRVELYEGLFGSCAV
jgi:hypothetical protein